MITESELDTLRGELAGVMSNKRYRHTVEVEKMAARLSELYCPEKTNILRAAALLHDITKEYSAEKQREICKQYGIALGKYDILSPKTFHAKTAARLIPEKYPAFAAPEVIEAVRWHTTGRADMTICEKILYLADYID